jgi:hypothetical protein
VTYVRKRACVHLCGKEKGRKVYMRERDGKRRKESVYESKITCVCVGKRKSEAERMFV